MIVNAVNSGKVFAAAINLHSDISRHSCLMGMKVTVADLAENESARKATEQFAGSRRKWMFQRAEIAPLHS